MVLSGAQATVGFGPSAVGISGYDVVLPDAAEYFQPLSSDTFVAAGIGEVQVTVGYLR